MKQGELFGAALKRPYHYHQLSERSQWEVDDSLGILDWDGSCLHQEGSLCNDCKKLYISTHKLK